MVNQINDKLINPPEVIKFNKLKKELENLENESYIKICQFYDNWHNDFEKTIDDYNNWVENSVFHEFKLVDKNEYIDRRERAINRVITDIKSFEEEDALKKLGDNFEEVFQELSKAIEYMYNYNKLFTYDPNTRSFETLPYPPSHIDILKKTEVN